MQRSMLLCCLTGIFTVTTCVVPASAYLLHFSSWPQTNLGDPVTVTYSYSNLLDGGLLDKDDVSLTPGFLKDAIDEALGTWASYAPLHFVEVEDNGPPVSDLQYFGSDFGQIRFGHHPFRLASVDYKAHAYFPIGGNLAGDVHFDDTNRWEPIGHVDPVTDADYPDVLGAAIHEIGHSIGIHHSDVDGANMFPRFLRHTGPRSGHLHPDDIAAVLEKYGAGVGSVSPIIETIDEYFDVRPRGEWNRVRLFGDGMLRMAVLSGNGFDISQIDLMTLEFGDPLLLENGGLSVMPKQTKIRDVNWDGLPDLTLVFRTNDLLEAGALGPETTEGTLSGVLFDGTRIAGTDVIEIVSLPQCKDWDHDGEWNHGKDWNHGEWGGDKEWNHDELGRDKEWNHDGEWDNDKDWNHDWGSGHHGQGHRCRGDQNIPEPATIILALIGVAVVGSARRRRAFG